MPITPVRLFQFLSRLEVLLVLVGGCAAPQAVLKLCLFPQLLSGRYRDTQTSITDSSAVYRLSQDKVSAQHQLWLSSASGCSLFLLPLLNL